MEIIILLTATLFSTTTMTLFSYAMSKSFCDLYKEPVLLEYVLTGLDIDMGKNQKAITGWLIHYFIGLLFVIGYFIPIAEGWYMVTWSSGLVFGALIGFIGILGWKVMFRVSGKMPMANPSVYYLQLFFAHIIFGLTTVAVYFVSQTH